MLLGLLLAASLSGLCDAVKCLDCVGRDCMGTFCEGDYCVLGIYAPRWGTIEWGEPRVVKGCMSGKMLESDIRSHCETVDEYGEEVFTCFCDKDYCNGEKAIRRLETTPVPMVTCICNGAHCTDKTCVGELCSYVINHRTHKSEQGCVNASVPLIERRSAGACMIPPITGAMHHTVSKDPHELLATESCVCASDFCNSEKPEISAPEKMKCQTFVTLEAMGTKVSSRNTTCTGEFCFKASIKSQLGHMSEYKTMGCASFIDGAELAEELQPIGCAKFESEKVNVETCFHTKDKNAIGRARANQESPPESRRKGKPSKPRKPKKPPPKVEIEEYEQEEENEEEEEEEEQKPTKGQPPRKVEPAPTEKEKEQEKVKEEEEEEEEEQEEEGKGEKGGKEGKEKGKEEEEEEDENEKGEDKEEEKGDDEEENVETTTTMFIFEGPTEAPIPEDSNATLVAVFVLLMILIVMAGVVWKFELHKRLFRASYDTVAGG
ncbi:Dynein heavy chain-like protein [Toxocara canis]|uniref:Dynein heavy chain-like protein n=1 Tax=Toxocara canis TaxID=6265 RepID=A0A0B2VYI6_TOXCA|nr:Dynein heavy chain-like protein [Toxocara canis]